eukprot:751347-Hanusia_phi.AAC.4
MESSESSPITSSIKSNVIIRLQHLEPKIVSKFVDRLPFICDGRVQLSNEVKQVTGISLLVVDCESSCKIFMDRESGLKGRVQTYFKKKALQMEPDLVRTNRTRSKLITPESKSEV